MLFWYFRQLVRGAKSCVWFGEGQKYEFLFCPLPPVCPTPEAVLQIKHRTIRVVLSEQLELFCHVLHFLANQTHPIKNNSQN